MKTRVIAGLWLVLTGWVPLAGAATVYTQPYTGSAALYQSSLNGTDYDQLTWDSFRLSNSVAITEVQWRGGYIYGGMYSGHVTNWTIAFYRDVGGFQPDVINPPFEIYNITGPAGETLAGSFGGTAMYDYDVVLPSPFQAVAGSNYWLLIVANEASIPDWAIAMGSGGNGGCFRRTAGMADWWYYRASGDIGFILLTSDGLTVSIAATTAPTGAGEIIGGGNYPVGSLVTLTAVPATNFGFVNWTENGTAVSANPSYQFPAAADRALAGNFVPRYSVAVSAAPGYGGFVTGGGTYNSNSLVTLLATAAPGYSFVNWTEFGNPVSTTVDFTFNIDSSRTLVANFVASGATATFGFDSGMPPVYPGQGMPGSQYDSGLTAYFSTLSGGWSIQNNFYFWVPGVFRGNFLYPSTFGSTMAIEFSSPVTNFSMAFFTGDVSSEYDVPTTIRVSGYTNSVMTSPVVVTTAKGDWLTGAYPEGTMSFSSATPFTKVKIDMPSGQSPPVSYLYWVDNIVVQYVAPAPVVISGSASPAAGGTIDGFGSFAAGSSVSLTATPSPGYDFVNWTENGVPVSASPSYTFAAETNRTLAANFIQLPPSWEIVTAASPSNGGFTYGGGIYTNSETVVLTAVPGSGYDFLSWTENGVPVSPLDSYTFAAGTNRFLVASFAPAVPPVLSILLATNAVVLSWPTNSINFTPEQTLYLGPANWTVVTNVVTVSGTNYQVVLPPVGSGSFFRLSHP